MALDKLVDSSQLDADLTTVANAIRTKGGTSAQLSFPQGMADAIAAIPSGGGSDIVTIDWAYSISLAGGGTPIKKLIIKDSPPTDTLSITSAYTTAQTSNDSLQIEEIEVMPDKVINKGSFSLAIPGKKCPLHTVRFGANYRPTSFYNFVVFQDSLGGKNFKRIYGIDGRNITGNNHGLIGSRLEALEEVTLVPNTYGQKSLGTNSGINVIHGNPLLLTDASLISIANGLCALNVSTIKFTEDYKTRLNQILGIVSSRTDDTGTYDFFTANENGDTTLLSFITDVKGWTVA